MINSFRDVLHPRWNTFPPQFLRLTFRSFILIFLFSCVLTNQASAQNKDSLELPRLRLGLNLGLKIENAEIQKNGLQYNGNPEISSNEVHLSFRLFVAHRIGRKWYLNSGLAYMNSMTSADATFSHANVDRQIRLYGQLSQNFFSFS